MMTAVYNLSDGKITRRVLCPESMVADQFCPVTEGAACGCPDWATHIKNGAPVKVPPSAEELIWTIRIKRQALLAACDWTQMPDVPLTQEQKQAWEVYRQQLRDFPATCDTVNPVWPVMPT